VAEGSAGSIFRQVWQAFEVPLIERERIVARFERLISVGCPSRVALRAALDEWANRLVNAERAIGSERRYLRGPHWVRINELSYLLADGHCEGWGCLRRNGLQRHHHHYESVGWESLLAISVVCDDCHRRITYEWTFQREIDERRAKELAERDQALVSLGEPTLPDNVHRDWPPPRINTGSA
jgi:hypothetical protein